MRDRGKQKKTTWKKTNWHLEHEFRGCCQLSIFVTPFLNPFLFQFSLFKRSPAVVISHEKERKNERARKKKEKKKNDHSFDDEKFE